MNITPLKKSILKETIIFAAVALILAGMVVYISMLYDEFTQKKSTLEGQSNQLMTEKQQLEASFLNVEQNKDAYQEALDRTANPGMFIDRQAIRDLFNIYRSQFFLKKLVLDMQPVTEVTTDAKFTRKTLVGIQSEVKMSFEAISDEDIYAMIRALHKELPGYARVHAIDIKRVPAIEKQNIIEIRKQGVTKLVEGSIDFVWYGIKSPDPNSEANKYVIKEADPRQRRRSRNVP